MDPRAVALLLEEARALAREACDLIRTGDAAPSDYDAINAYTQSTATSEAALLITYRVVCDLLRRQSQVALHATIVRVMLRIATQFVHDAVAASLRSTARMAAQRGFEAAEQGILYTSKANRQEPA
jgi:hypothetical protein